MTLTSGTRLGPYEILAGIGAGGIGEVYRARDTRLNRTVAIKILPEKSAFDTQIRERFDREAKVISSLDHPHICALYDVGEHDGTAFLVMQYLDGETLEARLAKGALPLDHALRCAIEIADALDRAHREGIVHRDLKPGNIMLTKAGAKVLDFGLAKLAATGAPGLGASGLPTTPPNITTQGSILGTLQYMAPEQLEGSEADARSDIFAFGAVLYEMLTGRKAFEGKSQASLISAIMSTTPPAISTLQPLTPPALERLVKKCLRKDPGGRWQSARDLQDELKWIAESGSELSAGTLGDQPRRQTRISMAWIAAGLLALASIIVLIIAGGMYFRPVNETPGPIRFSVALPAGWNLAPARDSGAATSPIAVSPDGRRIAIVARDANGKTLIWIRALDVLDAEALKGTEGASSPFWSPDGRSIGFFASGNLKKIDVTGGPPITLCAAPENMGGTWSASGVIVFCPKAGSVLQKVSAVGGAPSPATVLGAGETQHWRPTFLPDGRHFLYRSNTAGEKGPFYVASLDSTDQTLVVNADSSNILYAQGYLLFMIGTTLMAQPFDADRRAMTGEAFPVAERVETQATGVPNGLFSASANGVLAYRTGTSATSLRLLWFDRTGKELSELGERALYTELELSPDGRRAAVSVRDLETRNNDLWIFDVARNLRTRFTLDSANEAGARWTADGKSIAYYAQGKGMFLKPSGGSGEERRLLAAARNEYPDSWSPDQRVLLYELDNPKTSWDLWVLPQASGAKPYPFVQTPFREEYGRFSPDGRWIAYRSDDSGRSEIYVVPFPGPGDKWQVSTSGGSMPRWRRDGKEIFYLAADNSTLMSADVEGSTANFHVGSVRALFKTSASTGNWPYDVAADGRRFLVISRVEETSSVPTTVVVNWTAALKK